ncbi:hypothetical protein BCV70DRAFT_74636 [Testicularia cyperi]|uniref:Uncharacterized protein n=1 Tax=Testicularia cyperi TaxID=1882483 RepID=A0A317XT19_9BASI|nr:hypothetical protein BCV70DRAFT_74636 [Testicularia cyperi]
MASSSKVTLAELDSLALADILADLAALSASSPLLKPGNAKSAPQYARHEHWQTSVDHAILGDTTVDSVSTRDYVQHSKQLLSNFREVNRLNTEHVSLRQASLLLPAERGQGWSRSVAIAPSATRTDLLHTKVAKLQTKTDEWDAGLKQAVKRLDQRSQSKIESRNHDPDAVSLLRNSAKHKVPSRIPGPEIPNEKASNRSDDRSAASGLGAADPAEDVSAHPQSQPPSSLKTQTQTAPLASHSVRLSSASTPSAGLSGLQDCVDDDPWNDLT